MTAPPPLWQTIILAILASGVVAALVSGYLNHRAETRRNSREDDATKRQIRAAAHALAKRVIVGRQYGFSNFPEMESSLAYLEDLSKDRSVERALSDRTSGLLHEAIELCKTLIGFAKSQRIDAESILAADVAPPDRDRRLYLFSQSSKPTFDKLRAYFAADGASEIVAEFDKADEERQAVEAIRTGRG